MQRNDSILVVHIRTFLNIWYKLPKKGTGLGPGIPRDAQYPKCRVKYLQKQEQKFLIQLGGVNENELVALW